MTVAFEQTQLADYLTRLAASNLGRAYKALVVREMAIEGGHTVLDLGCVARPDQPVHRLTTLIKPP